MDGETPFSSRVRRNYKARLCKIKRESLDLNPISDKKTKVSKQDSPFWTPAEFVYQKGRQMVFFFRISTHRHRSPGLVWKHRHQPGKDIQAGIQDCGQGKMAKFNLASIKNSLRNRNRVTWDIFQVNERKIHRKLEKSELS